MKDFDFFDSIALIINRVSLQYRTKLYRAFKDNNYDITPEQWAIMNILFDNNNLSQTEIAEITLKDKTLITRMIDNLESKAIVDRKKDISDRRYYRISLTTKGREFVPILNQISKQHLDKSTKGISKSKIHLLSELLNQVENNINEII